MTDWDLSEADRKWLAGIVDVMGNFSAQNHGHPRPLPRVSFGRRFQDELLETIAILLSAATYHEHERPDTQVVLTGIDVIRLAYYVYQDLHGYRRAQIDSMLFECGEFVDGCLIGQSSLNGWQQLKDPGLVRWARRATA